LPFLLFVLSVTATKPNDWCGTVHETPKVSTHGADSYCLERSQLGCDTPQGRDQWTVRSNSPWYNFRVVYNILGTCDNTCVNNIVKQSALLNRTYVSARIGFTSSYRAVSSIYGTAPLDPDDAVAVDQMKSQTSYMESTTINVWVIPKLQKRTGGTLLGRATFPWTPAANTKIGGIIVNGNYFGATGYTLVHEMGHQLGLYHTFQGATTPSRGCTACSDLARTPSNGKGDLCADTPATSVNYRCSDPGETDCAYTYYLNTMYRNYMGYADDNCMAGSDRGFTAQQIGRMRCWSNERLKSLFTTRASFEKSELVHVAKETLSIKNHSRCESAMVLDTFPTQLQLDNTQSPSSNISCFGVATSQPGFWFLIKESGQYIFDTCIPGLLEDIVMAVFEGTCDSLKCSGVDYGNDRDCTTLDVNATKGQYIFVGSAFLGPWELDITLLR